MRTKVGEKPQQESQGDPNILKLGNTNHIRIVDPEQVFYKNHAVESLEDSEQVEFIVCPGPGVCPLCRKPERDEYNPDTGKTERVRNWPISKRYATNVWDYESKSVKVLIGGPQIFDEFESARKVGYDPTKCDFVIHKMGQRRSTSYKVVRGDSTPFEGPEITPDMLHDLDKYDAPDSVDHIFEVIEKMGFDYDAIKAPSFTEQEAMEFVLPFGRCRGMTVEQAVSQDHEWCEWLHGQKLADGALGDPVFIALQTVLESRGLVPPLDGVGAAAPAPTPTPDPDPEPSVTANGVKKVKLQTPDGGDAIEAPEDTIGPLLAAGFTLIEEAPAAEEAPEPEPIASDTLVKVKVGGVAIDMAFGEAVKLADSGTPVEFTNPVVAKAAEYAGERLNKPQGAQPADDPADAVREAAAQGEVEPPAPDADKPHKCPHCDWRAKTKGAVTQHVKREHADIVDADPPAAEPTTASTNGAPAGEDQETVLGRVKKLLSEKQFDDYSVLLDLFDEVAGKRNITDFTVDELLQLEQRVQAI